MIFFKPYSLKPGMILAKDLLGPHGELLLVCGQALTASHIEKLQMTEHKGAYIVDCAADLAQEDLGILSKRLKHSTVNALKSFFMHVQNGEEAKQADAFITLRYCLDQIIQEVSQNKSTLFSMADIKEYDEYTYYHCVNVAALSVMQGVTVGMNRTQLYKLGIGALLHDIGKIFVAKEIITKPGVLTEEEYEQVKLHSMLGSNFLRRQWEVPAESIVAVLTHHERYDGTGYPLKLPPRKQITEGKIIALSDVYDALISERPYRGAMSPSEAMEHVMGNSGILFDPELVTSFMRRIEPYPVGSTVLLSNGLRAIVIENNAGGPMRPKVNIIRRNAQGENVAQEVLDLFNDPLLLNVTVLGFAS